MRGLSSERLPGSRGVRSPSSALSHPFFGGGFSYKNRLQKKVGTLILTSLLEDLVNQTTLETTPRYFCFDLFGAAPALPQNRRVGGWGVQGAGGREPKDA